MITVPLHKAKARLHKLVEAAQAGEQVILLRGSEIVAIIKPIKAEDVELAAELTDEQALRFWEEVREKDVDTFSSPAKAVAHLKKRRS